MSLVLDAGALIALDRGDRAMWTRLKAAALAGDRPRTHPGVVAQVWRGGGRQARLAGALPGLEVESLDVGWSRRCGQLLARSGGSDVVDAGVALLAVDGDVVLTSDVADLARLLGATGATVEVVAV